VIWPHFWAIQIWLLVLFFMFCALRELIRALGRERVRAMFIGPIKADATYKALQPTPECARAPSTAHFRGGAADLGR
ncbi:MAG: hypothetical protein QNL90_01305, partial [Gammaproteobacteria bacterium]|nr:hypothetical protein [Gammaproteobacteria bacterium]MDX2458699.1 hypothetical protein [Gammaproteobacteria bacterium]